MMELSPGLQVKSLDKKPAPKQPEISVQSTETPSTSQQTQIPTRQDDRNNLPSGELEIEILPVVYDIIRCIEKDPVENSLKQRELQESSQKILELQKRFESARSKIKQLRGINYNKEEQQQRLELLKKQLKLKQQIIKKYKNTQF